MKSLPMQYAIQFMKTIEPLNDRLLNSVSSRIFPRLDMQRFPGQLIYQDKKYDCYELRHDLYNADDVENIHMKCMVRDDRAASKDPAALEIIPYYWHTYYPEGAEGSPQPVQYHPNDPFRVLSFANLQHAYVEYAIMLLILLKTRGLAPR